jgi:ABC-type uncharacterized transport system substrate-binding protein
VRYGWALAAVALVLVASAANVEAQAPARIPRIGLLSIGTDPSAPLPPQWVAFFEGLRALGYVNEHTIRVERGFAGDGRAERVIEFARGMVERQLDVIVVTGTREVTAARAATMTIPIVTIVAPDLVANGFVASLARPGGNITGLTLSAAGVGEKYVELLREAVPSMARVVVLTTRAPAPQFEREMHAAARALNLTVLPVVLVKGPEDFEAFFAEARRQGAGVVVPSDGVIERHRRQVVDLAAKHHVPVIYTRREYADVGGLMTYGTSFVELFRRAPAFIDKVLKGAKPAELPIEQPTKFDLVVNLKTARALGLSIGPALLVRADEVIQ